MERQGSLVLKFKSTRFRVISISLLFFIFLVTSFASSLFKYQPSAALSQTTIQNIRTEKVLYDKGDKLDYQTEVPKKEENDGTVNGQRKNREVSTDDHHHHEEAISRKNSRKNSTTHYGVRRGCDATIGFWVFDENYPPYYTNGSCPFIEEKFDCLQNGRLDQDYLKWRWQPQDCDIPRFDAQAMLDLIRGKRLVFVGDSLDRNQWGSLVCMLAAGITEDPEELRRSRKIEKIRGEDWLGVRFVDYNCTVEFTISYFLVNEGKARVNKEWVVTRQIDTIDSSSSRWKEADFLIFNTGHWWNNAKTRSGINFFQEGNHLHPKLDPFSALRSAIKTWSKWIDKNINPKKTQVFFQSMTPVHFSGGKWNTGGRCDQFTQPLNESSPSTRNYDRWNAAFRDGIKHMKTSVTFFDITTLTGYRADAHPSLYNKKNTNDPAQSSNSIQDCGHWCLPGVPDTWNQLLYFHLQSTAAALYDA